MSEIIIPERLTVRLSHDKTWDSCVTKLKENIEPLLAKDPDFFPDYTIHGIDHINRCLDIADHLIDSDTLSEEPKKTDLLTPRDVAFLICGILLHDMGMFLRPDGVHKLVQMDLTDDVFGGKPWKDEWSDYVDRTKRLSQEKMRYHFGKVIPVTEDCVNHTDTDNNKRIIGEFLRQHHTRLAHELALGVLPGSIDTDLFKNTNLKEKDRKLIGILARSHGMDIRDTEDYVNKHIGKGPKPYNTPIFYLMTILRTADALDADERRAPEALEQQQNIPVPISVEEWTWNQCIDPNGCDWLKEQKNRHIEADPKSSPQYVQLDKWLKGIQADLDLCWSILAEKYPYDRYRLSIHRVVSNIHEPGIRETMNEKFLTKEVCITANPDIVKLMMEPLYGNDPTYGVRELLQNAVDACLERERKEHLRGNTSYRGRVRIDITKDSFIITDNGIGMNEDVLLNYYLSAGSSYRNSDMWKADFAPDGVSQVARTGRFGVGFLASFLLGDTITVQTHHMDDKHGYQFCFDYTSRPLSISRIKRRSPGTTITIALKPTVFATLLNSNDHPWYGWYIFDNPQVSYYINGQYITDNTLYSLSRDADKNPGWFPLPSNTYQTYLWSPHIIQNRPNFYCNGIQICDNLLFASTSTDRSTRFPHISIIDNNAQLHVDLSRNRVYTLPDKDLLYTHILLWNIARLLLTPWDSPDEYYWNTKNGFTVGLAYNQERFPFLFSKQGFSLNHELFLSILGINHFAILYSSDPNTLEAIESACNLLPETAPFSIMNAAKIDKNEPSRYWDMHLYYQSPTSFAEAFITGRLSLFNVSGASQFSHHAWTALQLSSEAYLGIEDHIREIYSLNTAVLQDNTYSLTRESTQELIDFSVLDSERFPVNFQIDLRQDCFSVTADVIKKTSDLLSPSPSYHDQSHWIPYDMEERKIKFPKAFEQLSAFLEDIPLTPIQRKKETLEKRRLDLVQLLDICHHKTANEAKDAIIHHLSNQILNNMRCTDEIPHKFEDKLTGIIARLFATDTYKRYTDKLAELSLGELDAMVTQCINSFKYHEETGLPFL